MLTEARTEGVGRDGPRRKTRIRGGGASQGLCGHSLEVLHTSHPNMGVDQINSTLGWCSYLTMVYVL